MFWKKTIELNLWDLKLIEELILKMDCFEDICFKFFRIDLKLMILKENNWVKFVRFEIDWGIDSENWLFSRPLFLMNWFEIDDFERKQNSYFVRFEIDWGIDPENWLFWRFLF
jgi:hypothetical protein